MTNDQKLLGSPSKGRVSKLILFDCDETHLYLYIVRSIKHWSLYGGCALQDETPWQCMTREFIEESGVNLFDNDVVYARNQSSKGRIDIFVQQVSHFVNPPIAGEILESKWIDSTEVSTYTQNFWKLEVIMSAIQEYFDSMHDCPICGKKVNVQCSYRTVYYKEQYFLCSNHDEDEVDCFYHGLEREDEIDDESEDDDSDDWDDSDDFEPGPCDDCDDAKMPYAARSCEDCPHGGKGCLGELKVEEEDFDEDDDYILDMWGPNAVNRRHGK